MPYCDPSDYENCGEVDFFDVSDIRAISKIRSSFLSATCLPNIVQYNRLNSDSNSFKAKGSLGRKECQDIHQELISQGFLDRDNQIDLEYLKKKTKERLVFPDVIYLGSALHPITFVYQRDGTCRLTLTRDFVSDPLGTVNF